MAKRSAVLEAMIRRELLRYFWLNLDGNMSLKWKPYLEEEFNINLSLRNIYKTIVNSIEFSIVKNQYAMHITNTTTIGDLDVAIVAKLLDKGNLTIKGDNLISDGFKYIKDNIDNILLRYLGAI